MCDVCLCVCMQACNVYTCLYEREREFLMIISSVCVTTCVCVCMYVCIPVCVHNIHKTRHVFVMSRILGKEMTLIMQHFHYV